MKTKLEESHENLRELHEKLEESLKNLETQVENYISVLNFIENNCFMLKNYKKDDLNNLSEKQGVYFIEVKMSEKFDTFEKWLKVFKDDWAKDNITSKTPKISDKWINEYKKIKQKNDNWIPLYLGKSENIKKRVLEHFEKKVSSTTSALKLNARKKIYEYEFKLSIIEIETKYYSLLMHKIEEKLRDNHCPIVGKQ